MWSSGWSFTTVPPPPATPTLSSPADAATNIFTNPTLAWSAVTGASTYSLQVSTVSVFSSSIVNQTGITSASYAVSGLSNNTQYYWRVNATNPGGTSAWSTSRGFTTICSLPSQVVALPSANDTLKSDSILCRWNKTNPDVTKYQFQLFSDSLLTAIVSSDSTITDTSYTLRNLSTNQTYWWRVRAYNVAGWGAFSSVQVIIVRIQGTAVTPSSFTIAFSGASLRNGCIRYGIPKECFVSLAAYDVRGRLVKTFVAGQKSPGYYSVNLQQDRIATGRYFLQFIAGDYKRVIPFIN